MDHSCASAFQTKRTSKLGQSEIFTQYCCGQSPAHPDVQGANLYKRAMLSQSFLPVRTQVAIIILLLSTSRTMGSSQHQYQQAAPPEYGQQTPMMHQHQGNPALSYSQENEWNYSLFDCFSPGDVCMWKAFTGNITPCSSWILICVSGLIGCCFPYVTFGKTSARMKDPSLRNFSIFNGEVGSDSIFGILKSPLTSVLSASCGVVLASGGSTGPFRLQGDRNWGNVLVSKVPAVETAWPCSSAPSVQSSRKKRRPQCVCTMNRAGTIWPSRWYIHEGPRFLPWDIYRNWPIVDRSVQHV